MSNSFYTEAEQALKENMEAKIKHMLTYCGLDIEVYRTERDVFTNVYGKHAGTSMEKVGDIFGALVSDDFFTSGLSSSGNFDEGFLYTADSELELVGTTLKIVSRDGKSRNYRVESKEAIGMTVDIFSRYKISNLA